MRRLVCFTAFALSFCATLTAVEAQAQRPQFRPAVLGSKPDSLINRIDAAAVGKSGLKDGAVMFCSRVSKEGRLLENRTYRAMPGSEALEEEVRKRLEDSKVFPAIYNHQPVEVLLFGTVVFSNAGEKPRVRIVLHQDAEELKKESDFISPQPVIGADSGFKGLRYPQGDQPVAVTGIVDLALRVDANGNLQEMRILNEDPALFGFGPAATADFTGAKFIPAFRDGDPDESNTVLPIYYPKR